MAIVTAVLSLLLLHAQKGWSSARGDQWGALVGSSSGELQWGARLNTLRHYERLAGSPSANRTPAAGFDDTSGGGAAMPAEVVTTHRPGEYLPDVALPESWDWRRVALATSAAPMDFTMRVRNQFLPFWCGSCWAHAATAVLGSRWKIHSAATVDFSVQYMVNCVNNSAQHYNSSGHCHGGSAYKAFALAHTDGAVDSSCLPYSAMQSPCDDRGTCEQRINITASAAWPVDPQRYYAAQYGLTEPGEAGIMKEIYARGPVSCCMATRLASDPKTPDQSLEQFYTGGVFATTTNNRTACDHIVAIVGFGNEADTNYWTVQNSWGTTWGEAGFFRIKRRSSLQGHEHNLGIDKGQCGWAMPPAPPVLSPPEAAHARARRH